MNIFPLHAGYFKEFYVIQEIDVPLNKLILGFGDDKNILDSKLLYSQLHTDITFGNKKVLNSLSPYNDPSKIEGDSGINH